MGPSSPCRVGVIMAGGAGERFWPYSRRLRPKQLLPLTGPKPMLAASVELISPVIPPERVLIIAGEHLREPIIEALGPAFPPENVVVEPAACNTAACLTLAAAVVRKRFGAATMAVLTADHWIRPEEVFQSQAEKACELAETTGRIITMGIPAEQPETGFGYIEIAGPRPDLGDGIFEVSGFREKPDRLTAEQFVRSGRYFWNSGMFYWTVDVFEEALAAASPLLWKGYQRLIEAYGLPAWFAKASAAFQDMPVLPIDIAVIEKAPNRLVIKAQFNWDDIGAWTSLEHLYPLDDDCNIIRADYAGVDSHKNIIFQAPGAHKPIITTVGVENMIVVTSDDAVLICDRRRVQDVKSLLRLLRQKGREDLT